MKRSPSSRLTSFLSKPGLRVQELEARDVPAVFFVDPTGGGAGFFGGAAATPAATQMTPANTFTTLVKALDAAALNSEADTIYLSKGNINANNLGGNEILIQDTISLVGSNGGGAGFTTTVRPVNSGLAGEAIAHFVFETSLGFGLNLQDFDYNGNGKVVNGFKYTDGGVGTIAGVNFKAWGGFDTDFQGIFDGDAVWAREGSSITVTNSTFTNTVGRTGVHLSSFTGPLTTATITGSTFTGSGSATPDRVNAGIEVIGSSKATISGSTFTNQQGTFNDGSFGIALYADTDGVTVYSPEATILRNTFTNNQRGLFIGNSLVAGNSATGVADQSSALIAYNKITGSTTAAIQANAQGSKATQVVNARFNYFGSAAGPSGGNGIIGPAVNASQFLRTPLNVTNPNESTFVIGAVTSTNNPVTKYQTNAPSYTTTTATKTYQPADAAAEARVAYADLTGDGIRDVIVGSGSSDTVQVFNGSTGVLIKQFFALTSLNKATTFSGGVYDAAGDINGDGKIDLVVSQGANDPRIVVYDGVSVTAGPANASPATKLRDFQDSTNRGSLALGVTVAVGDFNGDGYDDIATSVAKFGSSNVRVFDGKSLTTGPGAGTTTGRSQGVVPNVDFFAFSGGFQASIAAGDVNGDGKAELVTSALSGGANIRVFGFTDSMNPSLFSPTAFVSGTSQPTLQADFLVGNQNAGVRVAVRDLNNDGFSEILYTIGSTPSVGVIDGKSLTTAAGGGTFSSTTTPTAPIGYTLLASAYPASSRGAYIA